MLAADGRIEGKSETVEVGPAISGVIDRVAVREGQRVVAGALLALVRCGDLEAEMRSAASAQEALRQERARLVRGRRAEERRIAEEQAAAAEADLREVRTRRARLEMLLEKDEIPRIQFDEVERQLVAAQARYEQAKSQERLANEGPLPEELAKMDSEIAAAGEHLKSVTEQAAKCTIRAPAAGTVLRVEIHAGETVSSLMPRPLFLLADTSRLRVRAEVDERDIGRIRTGQQVRVTADALGSVVLTGMVERVSPVMGRRTVLSGDPAEKTDRDTLEVLVQLDAARVSPAIGLRVTVRFLAQR
jgi:ABC exporter DevB family membrane fusion protein